MEQINSEGKRRPVEPADIARYDQMEAAFGQLTREFLAIREAMRKAAVLYDTAKLTELTGKMDEMVRQAWPDASPELINYVMFLVGLVEDAHEWTDQTFDTVNMLVRQLGALLRPGHPVHGLPGFQPHLLQQELDAALEATNRVHRPHNPTKFTTDTGVTLHKVHAEDKCDGEFCVIHRPAPGPWSKWDTHWHEKWRLMVRICPHDVSHVAIEEMLRLPVLGMIAHEHPEGCDCACDFSRCAPITDDEGTILGFQARQ